MGEADAGETLEFREVGFRKPREEQDPCLEVLGDRQPECSLTTTPVSLAVRVGPFTWVVADSQENRLR